MMTIEKAMTRHNFTLVNRYRSLWFNRKTDKWIVTEKKRHQTEPKELYNGTDVNEALFILSEEKPACASCGREQ